MNDQPRWRTHKRGPGPVVATAIHDGHLVGPAALAEMALDDAGRLREEDPFTGEALLRDSAVQRIQRYVNNPSIDLYFDAE